MALTTGFSLSPEATVDLLVQNVANQLSGLMVYSAFVLSA